MDDQNRAQPSPETEEATPEPTRRSWVEPEIQVMELSSAAFTF